ncbi:NADH dehydrogenase [ubiquinone] 1 beta subcomplex subunit 9-like [Centruroides sculpturatus]|uniref:NADH dehydrogenase [ubiquinone] 1 beta subcomplex subunit 9-like n=1 Tax=Centruroides sculpturatus TaxID=218467 RepID=UPI000C6E712B|nr:NADH dehydrogenase [ubiquinone] 1 beta subcomplex subunit 9-like [Centruroides sculpturatus]
MSYLQTAIRTHRQRVCSLYKQALRTADDWSHDKPSFRLASAMIRQRFEESKNETDVRKAKQLLEAGEEEVFRAQHYQPYQYANSPGGVAHGREVPSPDWVIDFWHPLEKAQYPEYFARREQRKKEYVERWEKQFGKPDKADYH